MLGTPTLKRPAQYLGNTLQSNLKWNKHINSITNKANQYLGFLKRNLKIKSSAVKYHAYKAFVRPKLEYASAVWDPHTRTQINQIEKVQRRAARYVTNRYYNTSSVTDMLQNLNWPSLEIRRKRVRLIMFYKIIHYVVAIHPLDTLLLPTTTITRYNSSHTYQHIRTDKYSYKYSFYPRTIIQWNLVPIYVHEAVKVDAFNPYSADFFYFVHFDVSCCLGISRKGSIYLFDLFHFFFKRGKIPNVPLMGRQQIEAP